MKTMLTVTLGSFLLLPVVALAAPPAPAQAPAQAPSKAVQAPVQAPMQAPAKTAQAGAMQPNVAYRSYSYMPGAAPAYYNYGGNYVRPGRPAFFSGHQPADYKVRGEFWAR